MKATEMEGEKRARIELGGEGEAEGFDGDMGTSDEHKGVIVAKGNQIFIQNITSFLLLHWRIYTVGKIEGGDERMCREREVTNGYRDPSGSLQVF